MSAVIRQLVNRKRMAAADAAAFEARRDKIVSEAKGERGPQGEVGPMPDHEWQGSKLRFQKPDGKWGKFKDLQGPKGEDGAHIVVRSGSGQEAPSKVTSILPGDEMLILRNGVMHKIAVQLYVGVAPVGAVTVNGEYVMVNGQFVVMAE